MALPVDGYNKELFLKAVNEAYQMSRKGSDTFDKIRRLENAPDEITKFADVYEFPLVDMAEFIDKSRSDVLKTRKNDWGYLYTSGTSKGTSEKVPASKLGMNLHKVNNKNYK